MSEATAGRVPTAAEAGTRCYAARRAFSIPEGNGCQERNRRASLASLDDALGAPAPQRCPVRSRMALLAALSACVRLSSTQSTTAFSPAGQIHTMKSPLAFSATRAPIPVSSGRSQI